MSIETFTPAEIEAAERVLRNALRTDFCAFVEKTFHTVCPGQTVLAQLAPRGHLPCA